MSNTLRSKKFKKEKRESQISKLREKVQDKNYNRQKEKRIREDN